MSETIRNRKEILTKLDEDRELNLDGSTCILESYVEQDELISYMKDELMKQRNIWKYCYSALILVIMCGLLYGMTEEEWGVFPNVVRVLTYGQFNNCMVKPSLSVSVILCVLTILIVFYPWFRIARYVCIIVPVVFEFVFIYLSHTKWSALHLGIPLLPVLITLLPIIAIYINISNRSLWQELDRLEEIRSKYKSV